MTDEEQGAKHPSLTDTISIALSRLAKSLDYDIEQDDWEVTLFRGPPHVSITFSRAEIEHISIETLYRLLQAGRHLKTLRPEDLEDSAHHA